MGCFEVEADEMWSFVKQKANKPWVWIAMGQADTPDHCVSHRQSQS
jgi:IS1 family transposase